MDQYAANSPTANDPGTTELILTQLKLLHSSGQNKMNRQHHNSTQKITSRFKFMLLYAFKMAVAIAFLRRNSKS